MRVLITGSAGVVGRAVRRALSAEHELLLLDRWTQECADGVALQADVTDWRSVRSALEPFGSIDAVVHLAFARTYEELPPEDQNVLQLDVTVRGTWIVLNEALRLGAGTCVFASSLSVFGRIDLGAPLDESADPLAFEGADEYGLAKTLAEDVVRHFAVRKGMRCMSLRLAAVHDPGVMERRGTHVDDIGEAFRLAVVSDFEGYEVVHLAPDNPGWALSNEKAKSMLGWGPKHQFDARPELADWSQPAQPPPGASGPPLGPIGAEVATRCRPGEA